MTDTKDKKTDAPLENDGEWIQIDAKGKVLGRLACDLAKCY